MKATTLLFGRGTLAQLNDLENGKSVEVEEEWAIQQISRLLDGKLGLLLDVGGIGGPRVHGVMTDSGMIRWVIEDSTAKEPIREPALDDVPVAPV